MKKLLKLGMLLAALLLVLLLVAAVFAGHFLDGAVKAGVESLGPQVTGTTVTVDSISLSPFSGSGQLVNLIVGNPEGFKTDGAFKLGSASVKLKPATLLQNPVVIESIEISGAEITFEAALGKTNIGTIMKHIEDQLASLSGSDSKGQTKLVIERFTLKDCTVRASATVLGGKSVNKQLPTLELTDIGKKSTGVTAAEAAGQILQSVFKEAAQAAASMDIPLPDISIEKVGTKLKDKIKGLFN